GLQPGGGGGHFAVEGVRVNRRKCRRVRGRGGWGVGGGIRRAGRAGPGIGVDVFVALTPALSPRGGGTVVRRGAFFHRSFFLRLRDNWRNPCKVRIFFDRIHGRFFHAARRRGWRTLRTPMGISLPADSLASSLRSASAMASSSSSTGSAARRASS